MSKKSTHTHYTEKEKIVKDVRLKSVRLHHLIYEFYNMKRSHPIHITLRLYIRLDAIFHIQLSFHPIPPLPPNVSHSFSYSSTMAVTWWLMYFDVLLLEGFSLHQPIYTMFSMLIIFPVSVLVIVCCCCCLFLLCSFLSCIWNWPIRANRIDTDQNE